MKNISKIKNGYQVNKVINYKKHSFGRYPSLNTARVVRDRLMAVNWDKEEYQKIRDELRAEGVEL